MSGRNWSSFVFGVWTRDAFEEEEGRKGGGGEECEKAKIMTEKADQTATGLAQSRDLFESEAEDNLKRSQSCVCNNIVCDCDENPDSLSLLDNCWVEREAPSIV